MQLGFLNRTPRGRMATAEAYRYFGCPVPKHLEGIEQYTIFQEREEG